MAGSWYARRKPRASLGMDWLSYRHWEPDLERYGPVRDYLAYNGRELMGENEVHDLLVEADVVADDAGGRAAGAAGLARRSVSGDAALQGGSKGRD